MTSGSGRFPIAASFSKSGIKDDWLPAFMTTGPATKITNLGAVKIVLGMKNFVLCYRNRGRYEMELMKEQKFGFGCMRLPVREHLKKVEEKFEGKSNLPVRKK